MASDLTKAKRKRASKRNIIIKNMLTEGEEILLQHRTEQSIEDSSVMIETLEEA